MNLISPHIKFYKLTDLAEDHLQMPERDTLLAHISTCRRCSEKLRQIKRTIEMMRADTMEDAPSYAIRRASELVGTRPKPTTSVLKQVLALLSFDSLQAAPAFAVRSAAPSERQLIFSAGENDLHLQIRQAEEQWVISGQVLGPCSGGEVELRGEMATVKTFLNDLCEFTLEPTPDGTYVLSFQLSGAQLKIPELKLGS
jgi:anti-sigma factor RsiW